MTSTLATTKSSETALEDAELTSVINRFDALKIRIEQAQEDEKLVKFQYNTPAGNKAARSHVYRLRQLRTAIDAARKEKKSAYLEAGKRVDADARELTDSVTVLIEAHETILKKIEQDEADRKARHQGEIDTLIDARTAPEGGWTLELVQIRLGVLRTLSAKRLESPEAYDFEEFTSSWLGELNIGIDFFERLLPDLQAAEQRKINLEAIHKQINDLLEPPELGWTEEILKKRIQVVQTTTLYVDEHPADFQPVPAGLEKVMLNLVTAPGKLQRLFELHSKAAIAAREQAEAEKKAAAEQAVAEAQRLWEEDQERKQREADEARAAAEKQAEDERAAAEVAAAEQRKKDEDARVEREVQEALDRKKKEDEEKAAAIELSEKIVLKSRSPGISTMVAEQANAHARALAEHVTEGTADALRNNNPWTENRRSRAINTLVEAMAGLNRRGIAEIIIDGNLHSAITVDLAQFE